MRGVYRLIGGVLFVRCWVLGGVFLGESRCLVVCFFFLFVCFFFLFVRFFFLVVCFFFLLGGCYACFVHFVLFKALFVGFLFGVVGNRGHIAFFLVAVFCRCGRIIGCVGEQIRELLVVEYGRRSLRNE